MIKVELSGVDNDLLKVVMKFQDKLMFETLSFEKRNPTKCIINNNTVISDITNYITDNLLSVTIKKLVDNGDRLRSPDTLHYKYRRI